MRGLFDPATAGGERGDDSLMQRRQWLVALLVAIAVGVSLGCATGAGAVGLSRAWLAHSSLRAFSTQHASRSLTRIASRSLHGAGPRTSLLGRIAAGRSAIGRDSAHAELSGGGAISGTVTSAATDTVIAGIEVCALTTEEPFAYSCGTTNTSGEYTLTGLEPGEYIVVFFAPLESQLNYVTQYYDDKSSESEAKNVPVTAGGMASGIDASLHAGGRITGSVVNGPDKAIAGIEVCALESFFGFYERCTTTNSSGEYALVGLASGEYDVEFSAPANSGLNYVTQFWDEEATFFEADAVPVTAGETTPEEIDATMRPGGEITGKVVSAATKKALEGILVCAYEEELEYERCSTTDSVGEYTILGLATGSYEVEFSEAFAGQGNYATQYYDDAASFEDAELVLAKVGQTTAGIDAELTLERPRDVTPPVISGSAVEGQVLKAAHGSWSNSPTSFVDEWGRCDAAGDLETCTTIGVGEELTLSAADVGHAIRLREAASNEGGKGSFAYSAPTAAVAALPPASGGSGSSGVLAPGGAGGNSGVLDVTTAHASAAQLKALLVDLLAPKGRNAKIEALLEHEGYVASFNALSGGQIVISWYLVPKGGHLATAKPTLVARGSVSFTAAGAAKLAIKLTANGRKLLKHAKELKLTAHGTITQSGEGAIGATESFTVRR
jgi:hypothetical protein